MSDQFVGTMPVLEQFRFDTGALQDYMRAHVEGYQGELTVEQFKGGQSNPTFALTAGGTRYVLRKKPSGVLLPSAHAVDREYRVITALYHTGVPVARSYCLCEDAAVIGTPFYIMAHVQGRVLWDPALPGLSAAERGAIYDDMNRVVATLHGVDVAAVGLADYGRAGNYVSRQIARWSKQYLASQTTPIEAMERLIAWLPQHIPGGETTTVVHGDLRLDNLIFHPTEPRIIAVLDWELSTLGDPLVDFAYHMLTWHLQPDEFRGMAGADLAALGIPAAHDYLRRYAERTGRGAIDPAQWDFYLVYNMFRLAAILQGIAKRVEDGTAANAAARATGAKARPIGELAWRMAAERLGAR